MFLVSLAMAKWASELQALSSFVSFSSSGACVAYVPEFLAKTESALNPLPRSFVIKYLRFCCEFGSGAFAMSCVCAP